MPDALGTPLALLCRAAGLERSYINAMDKPCVVPDATLIKLLKALGHEADTDEAVDASRQAVIEARWRLGLPPVLVAEIGADEMTVPFVLPAEAASDTELKWVFGDGVEIEYGDTVRVEDLKAHERARVDGVLRCRFEFKIPLPSDLAVGLYDLTVTAKGWEDAVRMCRVLAVPERCHRPFEMEEGARYWGFSVQLYGLISRRNWGIGDLTDLAMLMDWAGREGADFIGINPLHAGFPLDPSRISPYAASSRLWLDPIYLDIEAVPEFKGCPEACARVASDDFQAQLDALRESEEVEYGRVRGLKEELVGLLYDHFRDHDLSGETPTSRGLGFRAFQEKQGRGLRCFALFNALSAYFAQDDGTSLDWRQWPEAYRDPASPDVEQFAADHLDVVERFEYEQWLCETQLAVARARGQSAGMRLGLYMDLAVGSAADGSDMWADQDTVLQGVSIGAPPDSFNTQGQDWGFPTFAPNALRDAAYDPFIRMLSANMRRSDAMRIDHVLGLLRLYCMPEGTGAADGAYLRFPLADMLNIVAMESVRAGCLIIGEDLGTVPDGLQEQLQDKGLLSYRVFYFEQDKGAFHPPEAYPSDALVCISTHDLPTLQGYWAGRDLEWRDQLGHFRTKTEGNRERTARTKQKAAIMEALSQAGLGDQPVPAKAKASRSRRKKPPAAPPVEAIHRFLASTPSAVFAVQLEDVLGVTEQPNFPGTVHEHPNWRRKLPVCIEDLSTVDLVTQVTGAVRETRRAAEPAVTEQSGQEGRQDGR